MTAPIRNKTDKRNEIIKNIIQHPNCPSKVIEDIKSNAELFETLKEDIEKIKQKLNQFLFSVVGVNNPNNNAVYFSDGLGYIKLFPNNNYDSFSPEEELLLEKIKEYTHNQNIHISDIKKFIYADIKDVLGYIARCFRQMKKYLMIPSGVINECESYIFSKYLPIPDTFDIKNNFSEKIIRSVYRLSNDCWIGSESEEEKRIYQRLLEEISQDKNEFCIQYVLNNKMFSDEQKTKAKKNSKENELEKEQEKLKAQQEKILEKQKENREKENSLLQKIAQEISKHNQSNSDSIRDAIDDEILERILEDDEVDGSFSSKTHKIRK